MSEGNDPRPLELGPASKAGAAWEIEVTPGMVEAMAEVLCRVAGAYFDFDDKDDRAWLEHNLPKIYRAGRALERPRKSGQRRPLIFGY